MSGTYQSACIAKNMLETDDIVLLILEMLHLDLGLLVIKSL